MSSLSRLLWRMVLRLENQLKYSVWACHRRQPLPQRRQPLPKSAEGGESASVAPIFAPETLKRTIMQEQKNELRGDSRTVSLDSGTLSRKVSNYERLFLQPVKTAALHGKAIYVRPEFHQRIQRIVRIVDNDKISMYSYLDRVLEHHFATFDDEITVWCRNRFQALSRDLKTTLSWE